MRRDRLAFQPNDTLIFGFEFVEPDSASSAESFSSTTPAEDDGDDEGAVEGGESESAVSDATTRSRSRQRGAWADGHQDHSPDYSYQSGLDAIALPGRSDFSSAQSLDQLLEPLPRILVHDTGHAAVCCLPQDALMHVSPLCDPAS